jgi:(R,R)-butanediol dehydrogenase / meso-butanediol dehydrogenase / diacetyl reductase
MKAVIFQGVGRPLELGTVADPSCEPGQIILKVRSSGVCGSDLHWTSTPGALSEGAVLGHEFSGTVVEAPGARSLIGRPATALPMHACWTCRDCTMGHPFFCSTGRLVGLNAPGAFAEYVAVDAGMLQLLPAGVTFEEGALVEPLAVAHHAVGKAGSLLSKNVVVIGAGPIGAAVVFFARQAGAGSVIVSEPSAERRERASALGATAAINPFEANLLKEIYRLAGRRPDVVVVCGGSRGMIAQAIDLAGKRGHVVIVGACLEEDRFWPMNAITKNVTLAFSGGYEIGDFTDVIDSIEQKAVRPKALITSRINLEALPEAFELLRTPNDQCKLLIDFGG